MTIIQKGIVTAGGGGGGGGGTSDHTQLTNRAAADQHPKSAITGLEADLTSINLALAGKQSTITVSTTAPASPVVNQLWLDIN